MENNSALETTTYTINGRNYTRAAFKVGRRSFVAIEVLSMGMIPTGQVEIYKSYRGIESWVGYMDESPKFHGIRRHARAALGIDAREANLRALRDRFLARTPQISARVGA